MTIDPITTAPMSDDQLNTLHKAVAEGIRVLQQQSQDHLGRASVLWFALACQMEHDGALDQLEAAATWAKDQTSQALNS